jgi:phage gpG-like protein
MILTPMPSGLALVSGLGAEAHHVNIQLAFEPSVAILAARVDKFGADIRSFREPLRQAVKDVMIPSMQRNFDAGGRPRWVRLTKATIAQKGGNAAPLKRSGSLQRNMGFMSIWTFTRTQAYIADLPQRIWYGKVHQSGGKGTHEGFFDPVLKRTVNIGDSGAIPARPFIMIQRQDEIRIEALFKRWVAMRIRRAGL